MSPRLFSGSTSLRLLALASIAFVLSSCADSPPITPGSSTSLAPGGASFVYVVQQGSPNTVLRFTAGANGAVAPSLTLNLPAGLTVSSMTTDATGNLYIGGVDSSSYGVVEVYPAGASGNASPVRTLNLAAAPLAEPSGLALDSAGNLYMATYDGTISEYAANASGYAAATRTIGGTATGLSGLSLKGVAVDSTGTVYVAQASTGTVSKISAFNSSASGNVAPTRTLNTSYFVYGIALDHSDNLYVVEDSATATFAPTIAEFSPTASGSANPTRFLTLNGNPTAIFGGIAVDAAGNIFASEQNTPTPTTYSYSLVAFGPGASGTVSPAAEFNSTAWTSTPPVLAIH